MELLSDRGSYCRHPIIFGVSPAFNGLTPKQVISRYEEEKPKKTIRSIKPLY